MNSQELIDEFSEEGNDASEESLDEEQIELMLYESYLEGIIIALNDTYPEEMANGITITRAVIDNECLLYLAECDEDMIDIDKMKKQGKEMKSILLESLNSDDSGTAFIVKACVDAKKGIAYQYVGNKSGKTCTISFPYVELKDCVRNNQ